MIDGNNRSFKLTEMPEHGKTIVQTSKGNLSRIDFEMAIKCDAEGPVLSAIREEQTWINYRKLKRVFQN
ncbi:hypothetical protein DCS65_06740 [Bacillus subtilis]|nr:hypothetical protein DCS65_06740 [Bacillus subtilis]